jgi:hypothetical protein
MGLLNRIFGSKDKARTGIGGPTVSQLHDDETTTELSSKNAPRRELVQVVLRDTMRKHGIPSDWIECRILSVVSTRRGSGMHIQLVVRQGDDRLITYVHAFQESFLREIEKFEPRAEEWIFSLGWQFEGKPLPDHRQMPDPATWGADKSNGAAASAQDEELEQDLKALFAIRDAALKANVGEKDHPEFAPTQPGFDEQDAPPPVSR